MATSFWTEKAGKAFGELDPNDQLDIPVDWSQWLAEIGTTLATPSPAGHELIITEPSEGVNPLQVLSSTQINDDTGVNYRVAVNQTLYDATLHLGRKFGVTCRITDTNGQVKDKTLWYKIVNH